MKAPWPLSFHDSNKENKAGSAAMMVAAAGQHASSIVLLRISQLDVVGVK
jgi:hypothetical protein